jgi:hypothetical protein
MVPTTNNGAPTDLIRIHEPKVHTLSVSVQALRIGTKQVTQSVFRQLREEPIIDYNTGELTGVPWGSVQYFWGACQDGAHLHVVWHKGDQLRRCCLEGPHLPRAVVTQITPHTKASARERLDQASHLIVALAALAGTEDTLHGNMHIPWPTAKGAFALGVSWPPEWETYTGYLLPNLLIKVRALVEARRHGKDTYYDSQTAHRLIDEVARLLEYQGSQGLTEARLRADRAADALAYLPVARHIARLATPWAQHYQAIAALDQLFIAV